mmetsp:Transcript_14931/g.36713  ORF Transcript_14931/g.36713 Transcript_14931/m.36713 type:complete len:312 (-) Transcript_14931:173-1108(-)
MGHTTECHTSGGAGQLIRVVATSGFKFPLAPAMPLGSWVSLLGGDRPPAIGLKRQGGGSDALHAIIHSEHRYGLYGAGAWAPFGLTAPAGAHGPSMDERFALAAADGVGAAHVAQEVAEELERAGNLEIAKQLVRAADSLDAFADDFCSAAEAMAGAILDLLLTLEEEKLGVKWDPGKDIAGPKVNVLGADMDSETLTMAISATKASAYRGHLNAVIEQVKVGGALPRRVLEQLAGKLGFCTILSRWCTSFMANIRRGGINAIRDAARAAGVTGEQLRSILMKFGRWVDPRSLEVYLAEDYIAMGELTQRT